MKRKTKQTLKTLALSVLGIGAVVGACAGINALVEKQDTELKTIIPIFEVGGLKTEDGEYEETDGSIYTKQAFECKGLEITLDFDNTIKYQVFYYEDDGDFISVTEVISDNQDLVVPFAATHARLEITPSWDEMGKDYEKTSNQFVKWYETYKYSNQMTIKVLKDQDIEIVEKTLTIYDPEDAGTEFVYVDGMTWLDFIESEYNTNSYFEVEDDVVCGGNLRITYSDNTNVKLNDKIDSDLMYRFN